MHLLSTTILWLKYSLFLILQGSFKTNKLKWSSKSLNCFQWNWNPNRALRGLCFFVNIWFTNWNWLDSFSFVNCDCNTPGFNQPELEAYRKVGPISCSDSHCLWRIKAIGLGEPNPINHNYILLVGDGISFVSINWTIWHSCFGDSMAINIWNIFALYLIAILSTNTKLCI